MNKKRIITIITIIIGAIIQASTPVTITGAVARSTITKFLAQQIIGTTLLIIGTILIVTDKTTKNEDEEFRKIWNYIKRKKEKEAAKKEANQEEPEIKNLEEKVISYKPIEDEQLKKTIAIEAKKYTNTDLNQILKEIKVYQADDKKIKHAIMIDNSYLSDALESELTQNKVVLNFSRYTDPSQGEYAMIDYGLIREASRGEKGEYAGTNKKNTSTMRLRKLKEKLIGQKDKIIINFTPQRTKQTNQLIKEWFRKGFKEYKKIDPYITHNKKYQNMEKFLEELTSGERVTGSYYELDSRLIINAYARALNNLETTIISKDKDLKILREGMPEEQKKYIRIVEDERELYQQD